MMGRMTQMEPVEIDCTEEEARAVARAAVGEAWPRVAHLQDQVEDDDAWLAHLVGCGEGNHEGVEELAEEQIAMLAMALRRKRIRAGAAADDGAEDAADAGKRSLMRVLGEFAVVDVDEDFFSGQSLDAVEHLATTTLRQCMRDATGDAHAKLVAAMPPKTMRWAAAAIELAAIEPERLAENNLQFAPQLRALAAVVEGMQPSQRCDGGGADGDAGCPCPKCLGCTCPPEVTCVNREEGICGSRFRARPLLDENAEGTPASSAPSLAAPITEPFLVCYHGQQAASDAGVLEVEATGLEAAAKHVAEGQSALPAAEEGEVIYVRRPGDAAWTTFECHVAVELEPCIVDRGVRP